MKFAPMPVHAATQSDVESRTVRHVTLLSLGGVNFVFVPVAYDVVHDGDGLCW